MVVSYKDLFKNRNFTILAIVQVITYFGAWFSQVGVYQMLVQDFKASEWVITLSTIFAFLPTIVLAPISGIIIDSFKPKTLLILMASIELFSVAFLLLINDLSMLWFLFLLIFVRLAVASIYFQTQMALLANILNPGELKSANELYSMIWAASYTAGMACSGVFIHFYGVKAAFILDCILFGVGIFLLTKTQISIEMKKSSISPMIMIKDGFAYIMKNKKIFHILILHSIVGFTTYDALVNFLAKEYIAKKVAFFEELLSAAILIGLSNAIRAVSLTIGPAVLKKIVNHKTTFYIYIAQGFGIFIWAVLQDNFYVSLFGLICAGFCTSTLWSYTFTELQVNCDKEFYGRVLAYNDMIYMLVALFTTFFIGYLHSVRVSLSIITMLIGGSFFLGAIYWRYYIKRFI